MFLISFTTYMKKTVTADNDVSPSYICNLFCLQVLHLRNLKFKETTKFNFFPCLSYIEFVKVYFNNTFYYLINIKYNSDEETS